MLTSNFTNTTCNQRLLWCLTACIQSCPVAAQLPTSPASPINEPPLPPSYPSPGQLMKIGAECHNHLAENTAVSGKSAQNMGLDHFPFNVDFLLHDFVWMPVNNDFVWIAVNNLTPKSQTSSTKQSSCWTAGLTLCSTPSCKLPLVTGALYAAFCRVQRSHIDPPVCDQVAGLPSARGSEAEKTRCIKSPQLLGPSGRIAAFGSSAWWMDYNRLYIYIVLYCICIVRVLCCIVYVYVNTIIYNHNLG